jgi:hypothetical protein
VEENGQPPVPAALPPGERDPGTRRILGWVGPTTDLGVVRRLLRTNCPTSWSSGSPRQMSPKDAGSHLQWISAWSSCAKCVVVASHCRYIEQTFFSPTTTEQKPVGVYTRHVRVQNLVTCNRACLQNLRATMTWHTGVLHNLLETSADLHKMQITKASKQPAQVACYSITSHIQCIDNSSYMVQQCTVVAFIQLSSVFVRPVCNHLHTMWAIDVIQPTNYLDTTLICIIIHINRPRFVCDITIYWTTNGSFLTRYY